MKVETQKLNISNMDLEEKDPDSKVVPLMGRSSLITATLFLELVWLISEMRDITKHFLLYNSYELHQMASK